MIKKIAIGIMACAVVLWAVCLIVPSDNPPEPKLTHEQIHDSWVKSQFSEWDGSNVALVDLVKQNLNDPKSFEHVDTSYIRQNDDLLITMQYRANNIYGAKVLSKVTALASYKDNTVTITN